MATQKKSRRAVDTENSQTPERRAYLSTLKKIASEGVCPFCEKNLSAHHPKPIIIKGKHWLVTPSNWPYRGSRYHFLFIPRVHVEKVELLSKEQWAELQKNFQKLSKKYRLSGATLMMRSGKTAITGATVHHLHAHLIVGGVRKHNSSEIFTVVGFAK